MPKTKLKSSSQCGLNVISNRCVKGEKQFKSKCKLINNKCKLKQSDPKSDLKLSPDNELLIKEINYQNMVTIDLPDLDILQKDVVEIVTNCWKNKHLTKRASFNSKDFKDLFTKKLNNKDVLVIDSTSQNLQEEFVLNSSDDKRPLMDILTNFNTKYFWQNKKTRLQFIYLVLFTFQTMLREIYKIKITIDKKQFIINENNLNIMFKGGNTLRMVIKELIRNFEAKTEKYILNIVDNYIKIGDFDFEFISHGLPPAIVTKFNMINFIVMLRFRNYLSKHNIFDFFNYNDTTIKAKIKLLKNKFNDLTKNLDKENWFSNIKVDYIRIGNIIHGTSKIKETEAKYKYRDNNSLLAKVTKRIDFAIIQDGVAKSKRNQVKSESRVGLIKANDLFKMYKLSNKIINLTTKTRKEGFYLYCTHNSIVNIHNDIGHNFNISFQLNRIKFNYVIYYRKKIKGKIYHLKDDISGEILDLNHTYKEDRKKYKFKKPFNNNQYLTTYIIPKYNISFYSYSLIGMLDDLDVIIFDEVNYKPWDEVKYKKRLYRVLVLTFLMYFNKQDGSSYQFKLNQISQFIKNLQIDQFNTKLKNKQLKSLQSKLHKTYQKRDENREKYIEYKKRLMIILNDLYKVFVNQYLTTRNQVLSFEKKQISSNIFTI